MSSSTSFSAGVLYIIFDGCRLLMKIHIIRNTTTVISDVINLNIGSWKMTPLYDIFQTPKCSFHFMLTNANRIFASRTRWNAHSFRLLNCNLIICVKYCHLCRNCGGDHLRGHCEGAAVCRGTTPGRGRTCGQVRPCRAMEKRQPR